MRIPAALVLIGSVLPQAGLGQASASGWTRVQTVRPASVASSQRLIDVDDDGRHELVVLSENGDVSIFAHGGGGQPLAEEPRSRWTLADPKHSIVDFARFEGGAALVVASPRGLVLHAVDESGSFRPQGQRVARRARFELRTNEPRWVDFVHDVNGDGRPDCVLPTGQACVLWQNVGRPEPGADGSQPAWPGFRRTASIAVPVQRTVDDDYEDLSHVLKNGFSIPGLTTEDVNGDGKADLLVANESRRAFHLQQPDGSYPVEPDVTLDLSIFRDTTERAKVLPGRTLAVDDEATYQSRDIDGDEIPDYVIAHRRKVWVFHASEEGPQFEDPATILKAADDVTALMLLHLDDDERADLMLVKVQVPTVATLVRGIFGEWDVEISAAGYVNEGGRTFETAPSRRGEIVVRMPAILGVLKDPEGLIRRFEKAGDSVGLAVYGDFDGNGARDVGLATQEEGHLRIWLSAEGNAVDPTRAEVEDVLRRLLFEDEDRVWDIERILLWLGNFAERRAALLTGGREPDGAFPLRDREAWDLHRVLAADFDGDGSESFVLTYRNRAGALELDVVERE